ncbi:MAG: FG-GAP-like repeat-containing protein [Phycisphaerales bacterium JB039]
MAASRLLPAIGALAAAAAGAQPLDYADRTGALASPAWDGGRTTLALADLNLDGHPDLVTVGDHGSPFIGTSMHGVTVWLGDGAGGWTLAQTGDFGYGGVAVGDVNDDGLPDVAYGVHHNYSGTDLGDQLLEVALGDGTGRRWTPWDDGLAMEGQAWGMFGTVLADLDADGLLDVASVSFGCCDGLHAYRNNGDGTWMRTFGFIGGNSSVDLSAADVNNDGYPDLIAAHQNGTVWLNDGAGGFTLADAGLPPAGIVGRIGPDGGDVNGDGAADISFTNSAGGVEVYTWSDTGLWQRSSAGLPASGVYDSTRLADMDRDGDLDVVAFGDAVLTIWTNDGAGAWTEAFETRLPAPGGRSALAVGDTDHNGRPDIAIVADEGAWPSERNALSLFAETSLAITPDVLVTHPRPDQTLINGAAVFIDWLGATPSGASATVDLALSINGPGGPWLRFAVGAPNSGRYQLRLATVRESADAWIRVTLNTSVGAVSHAAGPLTIYTGSCYADCDGSGSLDFFDFLCFQNLFSSSLEADCDGSDSLDFFDFLCFQDLFAAGCP